MNKNNAGRKLYVCRISKANLRSLASLCFMVVMLSFSPGCGACGPLTGETNCSVSDATSAGSTWTVSSGAIHNCAISELGNVKCWGEGRTEALGYERDIVFLGDDSSEMGENLAIVNLGTDFELDSIFAGSDVSCAVAKTGALKCWGSNGFGVLGKGDKDPRGNSAGDMGDNLTPIDLGVGRSVTKVSIGTGFMCAILDNSLLKCWGVNEFDLGGSAILGLGDTETRGDNSGEMGDNLPYVDLGTGVTVVEVSAGLKHTCAVLNDGKIKCWGEGIGGKLGSGDEQFRGSDVFHMGDNLPFVDLGSGRTAVSVKAGDSDTCALLDNGQVKCWGRNEFGTAGQGHTNAIGDGANEMGDNLATIDLGTGRTATQIVLTSTGTACALLDNGDVKCWGRNNAGQLGIGSTEALGDEAGELGDNLLPVELGSDLSVSSLSAGSGHVCANFTNGKVKCWGINTTGNLGIGDTSHRGDDPDEMGDFLPFVDL